jgi:integrase
MALRVTDTGHKSFVLIARYPSHPKHPTRRSLGDVGKITLEDARDKAREWSELIDKSKDPKIEEARKQAATQRQQNTTFAFVAAEFLERHASKLKKNGEAKRIIEAEFVKRWGPRPIGDILPQEISAAIRAIVKRGSPYQAHNALGYIRGLFSWAIGTGEFGITTSPVDRIKPKALIGEKVARDRVLSDIELRAIWAAAGKMGYPYGPVFRLLMLTGQRELEIAGMSRAEVDDPENPGLLTIPASRMKGGKTHEVPLTPKAAEIVKSLPSFSAGDYVFTTTDGLKSINGFSKSKTRIDKLSGITGWTIQDVRRTARTRFSALPAEEKVRELTIAHVKKGLDKNYDHHDYRNEKRALLEQWERRLMAIVDRPPDDVADLARERERRRA